MLLQHFDRFADQRLRVFGRIAPAHGKRYRWLLLLSVMVGTMASIATIVSDSDRPLLRTGPGRAHGSSFMVATTVSMLITPWLLARYGYHRTYVGWCLLLLVGGWWSAACRIPGAGAGCRSPRTGLRCRAATSGRHHPARVQPMSRGASGLRHGRRAGARHRLTWAVCWWTGFGWRSIFFMVVPFCLALNGLPVLPPVTSPAWAANRLDWRGLCWDGTLYLLNRLVAAVSCRGGVLIGARVGNLSLPGSAGCCAPDVKPLMDLRPFQYRQFAMGSVVAFIYGTALFGSTYLLPVFVQLGLELSASHVGTLLLPSGVCRWRPPSPCGGPPSRTGNPPICWSAPVGVLACSFGLMVFVGLRLIAVDAGRFCDPGAQWTGLHSAVALQI